jgi:hypothetical protein
VPSQCYVTAVQEQLSRPEVNVIPWCLAWNFVNGGGKSDTQGAKASLWKILSTSGIENDK